VSGTYETTEGDMSSTEQQAPGIKVEKGKPLIELVE
jgi:hypothetical protein